MGERKSKLAEGRVRLLKEAIENLISYGVREDSLLEEVLGKRFSQRFERYRHAFTHNEIAFMSIVLNREAIPFAPFCPLMFYRYRHYALKLYSSKSERALDKLAIQACEDLLDGFSRRLPTVKTLLDKDLVVLGIEGEYTVRDNGSVSLWVHAHNGLTSKCGEPNFNSKLPFCLQTSLEQIYQAAQFRRNFECLSG